MSSVISVVYKGATTVPSTLATSDKTDTSFNWSFDYQSESNTVAISYNDQTISMPYDHAVYFIENMAYKIRTTS